MENNINIKDEYRLRTLIYKKGYIGIGNFKSKVNNKNTKSYSCWYNMLTRCYSEKLRHKFPTYINCIVCEEWLNYQNFAKWFENNYIEGFDLDKDILSTSTKIYSPQTCCFIPQSLNKLLTKCNKLKGLYPIGVTFHKQRRVYIAQVIIENKNKHLGCFNSILEASIAYKEAKEKEIKRQAFRYKNKITIDCYNKLISYKIPIYDN